ncbi:MAG TPA: glycosyltransferase family 1 protein [Kiritimatiellia bacterium]|nr:glycosyltransferase family 1 protein [Kiritimatiellia bacterium]
MRIGVMLRAIDEKQGIGIYTQNLMERLPAMDPVNEYVLYYRKPEYVGRYARFPNVTESYVAAGGKMAWDQIKIPAVARRDGIDVIFHPKFTVPFFTKKKTVMTIHGASWYVRPDLYPNKLDLAYVRATMPFYCRKSDFIIANSDLTRNDFIRILRVPPEKIRTVRLGTSERFRVVNDQAELDAVRAKYKLPEKYILSVIKYDRRKNFENLIAAFRLLRKRIPCKLVITGIGCEKYIEEYNLAGDGAIDDVQFLGWVDQSELPALYTMATCHFFPSVYEEFGIPACEAMACGCPPVVSSTGALPEIVGSAGVIVDPFNPPVMADGLERVYTQTSVRDELSRRSLARAADFTWDRCARETLEVLNGMA